MNRVAVLLDGEFVKKVLGKRLRRPATHRDISAEVRRIRSTPELQILPLYRVFYYTADPLPGRATNPLDGLAWRDGLGIHPDTLGTHVRSELRVHADRTL